MAYNDEDHQEVLPVELSRTPMIPASDLPFSSVAVRLGQNDRTPVLNTRIAVALRLARKVEILLVDLPQASILDHWEVCGGQINIRILKSESEVQQFVENESTLDLLLGGNMHLESMDLWNKQRRENRLTAFSFLLEASSVDGTEKKSSRPYMRVSIGGTFNNFHDGHREYLELALSLADRVHLFVSTDVYAGPRKDYLPRSYSDRTKPIRKFLRQIGEDSRVEIEPLADVAEIREYVEKIPDLDLVLVERSYLEWFEQWNERRHANGLARYDVLCKARTMVSGVEVASSMWADKPKRRRAPVGQLSLGLMLKKKTSKTN